MELAIGIVGGLLMSGSLYLLIPRIVNRIMGWVEAREDRKSGEGR